MNQSLREAPEVRNLNDFVRTGYEAYYPITETVKWQDSNGVMQSYERAYNQRLWTITFHEPSCRFAKGKSTTTYMGSNGMSDLLVYGFEVPTRTTSRTVFKGCKVCGTVNIPHEEWADMVTRREEATRAAKAEADRRYNLMRDQENAAYEQAKVANEAVTVFLDQFADQVADIRAKAIADWREANPEKAEMADAHEASRTKK